MYWQPHHGFKSIWQAYGTMCHLLSQFTHCFSLLKLMRNFCLHSTSRGLHAWERIASILNHLLFFFHVLMTTKDIPLVPVGTTHWKAWGTGLVQPFWSPHMIMESNLTVLSVIIKRKTENQDSIVEYPQSPSWRNSNLVDN